MPSKTEVAKVKDLSPAIIDLERLMTRMNEVNVAIGRRAYELFEARGREHGHDQEDWLDAERELVQFFPVTSHRLGRVSGSAQRSSGVRRRRD